MGGRKAFVNKLQKVFDEGLYDPANEPDIAYPYLFSYFKGEEWRTSKIVSELLDKYYTTRPDGLPGNDDTGTMSAWAVFSMMGVYPDCPGEPTYSITTPVFDKVLINTPNEKITIECDRPTADCHYIAGIEIDGKPSGYRITHKQLTDNANIKLTLKKEAK
jgi:predicted alpha-1,2-mannosidase